MKLLMRCALVIIGVAMAGCSSTPGQTRFNPQPGQGQYAIPAWQLPQPTPRVPDADVCNAQFYQRLLGAHEGSLFVAGLPGSKRVLKPAFTEEWEEDFPGLPEDANPYREVRDYLPDQTLYAPSIRTTGELLAAGEFDADRLTLLLDADGYVQAVSCG